MGQYREGDTAVNPQTGQRKIYQGGSWKPLGTSGVMSDTKEDQAALEKMRADARNMEMVARRAREFVDMNKDQRTGGIGGFPGMTTLLKPFNANIAAMDAITSDVVPQKRPPGSGSSSDKDVAMYRGSFPSVDNPGSANVRIRNGIEAERDTKAKQAQFYDSYFAKNGTLLGADRAWSAASAPKPQPVNPSARPAKSGPTVGAIENGFRFKGGDPSSPSSWVKAN